MIEPLYREEYVEARLLMPGRDARQQAIWRYPPWSIGDGACSAYAAKAVAGSNPTSRSVSVLAQ